MLTKFGPKNQNCQFKQKLGTQTNSNIQNSITVFAFYVLDQKHHLWTNLVQKIKIVSLSLNLVPRFIRICRIQWWCSLFLFIFLLKTPFFYCLCDRMGMETLKQATVVNISFLFSCGECVHGMFLCAALKTFK